MLKQIVKMLVLAFIVFLFLQILFATSFWQIFELKTQDFFFLIRGTREISNDIVIVAIDDDSFSSLQTRWPFPRSYFARVIENLQKAEVRLIVVDVEFTEYSSEDEDEIFQKTLQKYDNVILAGKIIEDSAAHYRRVQVLRPVNLFHDSILQWGIVNTYADRDGFVRRYTLYIDVNGTNYYSLGVEALKYLYNVTSEDILEDQEHLAVGQVIIPKISSNQAIINYYGPEGTFKSYSFVDIMDDKDFVVPVLNLNRFEEIVASGELKDKVVFIGATAPELKDYFYTPFSIGERHISGVEIHGNFLEMTRNNDYLKVLGGLKKYLVYFFLMLVMFFISFFIKPAKSIFVVTFLIIFSLVLGYYLFASKSLLIPVLQFPVIAIFAYIIGLIFNYVKAYQERKFIKSAFQKYLSEEIVEELINNPKKLEYGGVSKEVTILFSDIRSFTTYSEKHTPAQTVEILREYLTSMVKVIKRNNGLIDKFIGDAIVAIFNVPLELDNHPYYACKAAYEMSIELERLKKKWQTERRDIFEIGVGINTGNVIVGNLGSEQIFDYTAIGDPVNMASRAEGLNKEYSTKHNIIITEFTNEYVKNTVQTEYLDEVIVKGKTEPVKIYQVTGLVDQKN